MLKLIVIKGPLKDQVFDLGDKDTLFCGRHARMNDISIPDIAVSRKHFKIFRIGKALFVEDLKSNNGTKINDKNIEPGEGFQVVEGDIITIGKTVMRLAEVSEENVRDKYVRYVRRTGLDRRKNSVPVEQERRKGNERRRGKDRRNGEGNRERGPERRISKTLVDSILNGQ